MGGRKKKPLNPAPLPERQPIQSTTVESFLQSPLCFIFFPSLLLRIPSHSFKFFSRARPPPRPSPPALRAQQERGSPEGSAVAASLPRLLAKSGRPEAAANSSQLLRIHRAKQHASCASLLGAEPGEWGRGKRFGGAGSGWAQTRGSRRPRARPLCRAAGDSLSPPLPRAADNLRGGKGLRTLQGHSGGLEKAGAGPGLRQVLRAGCAFSYRGQALGKIGPQLPRPHPPCPQLSRSSVDRWIVP